LDKQFLKNSLQHSQTLSALIMLIYGGLKFYIFQKYL